MKARPIIFSGEMVRAILRGEKTQTRRVAKKELWPIIDESARVNGKPAINMLGYYMPCPYGEQGDRLWVRETWGIVKDGKLEGFPLFEYERPDTDSKDQWKQLAACEAGRMTLNDGYVLRYRADGISVGRAGKGKYAGKWRPSIHMPRWASRILLEVVSIRVERIQDISEEDAQAEGCRGVAYGTGPNGSEGVLPSIQMHSLWDKINAKRGYGWDVNPWVWVVGFKMIEVKGMHNELRND